MEQNTSLTQRSTRGDSVILRTQIAWEEYAKVIATLEAAKNEQFAPETIRVWYEAFQQKGWTIDQVREAASNVMDTNTYGGVRFDHFVSAQKLYTETECKEMVSAALSGKVPMWKDDLTLLARAEARQAEVGLMLREMDEIRMREKEGLEERRRKAVEWFAKGTPAQQKQVLDVFKAKDHSIIHEELWPKYWKDFIRVCMIDILDDVEKLME